jgi:uroporphyrin-III C-methyltransferase
MINKKIHPKLSIVGAGPGDPDLLTLKAIKTLGLADVILYDALVNKAILDFAPANAIFHYVGKRKNLHTYTQSEINQLIVNYAFSHGHVVRLKGGDPFVFGRGKEEILHAESFNIETAFVAGISSSIAVAGSAGIPVTHRGISESFWVITGTTYANELSEDLKSAVHTNATVVVLMGLGKIAAIADLYIRHGKGELPIAIVQNGTLPNERIIIGNAYDIVEKVSLENIQAPAIIIIGEVVKLHPNFQLIYQTLELNSN